jgi:hypothetical protein
MVTDERGTFKRLAKNSMQASLARPSTGGAVIESLRGVADFTGNGVLLGPRMNLDLKGHTGWGFIRRNHWFSSNGFPD